MQTWPLLLPLLLAGARAACPAQCACASPRRAQCRGAAAELGRLLVGVDPAVAELHLETGPGPDRVLRNATFALLPRLLSLSVELAALAQVEPGAFQGLPELRYLSLARNRLRALPPEALLPLHALDRLLLSGNPLLVPPPLRAPSLRWLQMDACGLHAVPAAALSALPNLRLLQLRRNPLAFVDASPLRRLEVLEVQGGFLGLGGATAGAQPALRVPPALSVLRLDEGGGLRQLPPGFLSSARGLRLLSLSRSNLTALHRRSLRALRRLGILDLSGNLLNSSQTHSVIFPALRGLKELEYLEMRDNVMESLDLFGFLGMASLRTAVFSGNRIRTVADEPELQPPELAPPPPLESLDLSGNLIDYLGSSLRPLMDSLAQLNLSANRLGSFSGSRLVPQGSAPLRRLDLSRNRLHVVHLGGLSRLSWLSLARNRLRVLPARAFRWMRGLQHLDLSFNHLVSLPEDLFAPLKGLKQLYLASVNELGHIKGEWPAEIFRTLNELHLLSLKANHITEIPDGFFIGLYKLCDLDLSYNLIATINLDIFDGCPLKKLNLERNKILTVSCQETCPVTSIVYINLARNSMEEIPLNFSKYIPHLERLDVSRNAVKSLPLENLRSLHNLSWLNVSGNPLVCDCNDRDWLRGLGRGRAAAADACQLSLRCGGGSGAAAAAAAAVGAWAFACAFFLLLDCALLALCLHRRRRRTQEASPEVQNALNAAVEMQRAATVVGVAVYYGSDESDGEAVECGFDPLVLAAARRTHRYREDEDAPVFLAQAS